MNMMQLTEFDTWPEKPPKNPKVIKTKQCLIS